MIAAILILLAAAQGDPQSPNAARDRYRSCVIDRAGSFHRGDLSGDPAEMIGYAAIYSCSRERFDFIRAVEAFSRTRHPDLGPGSLAKTIAIFVEQTDVGIEEEVAALVGSAANAQGQH
jgi:hypothetical protein